MMEVESEMVGEMQSEMERPTLAYIHTRTRPDWADGLTMLMQTLQNVAQKADNQPNCCAASPNKR